MLLKLINVYFSSLLAYITIENLKLKPTQTQNKKTQVSDIILYIIIYTYL